MNIHALEINNFTKKYGEDTAVDNISLLVPSGDFFGFLGPNGAGKSTTIHCISGIGKITSGTIKIFGVDVVDDYREARSLVGLSPQEFNVDIFATVRDILWVVAGYYSIPRKVRNARVDELIERFKLTKHANKRFQHLSGGLKRRVMLAKAIVHDPKLLILDEPTAGVDVELRYELWGYLKELNNEGKTIILTSHYLDEIERLCNTIAIINNGTIVSHGTKDELIKDGKTLEQRYLEITGSHITQ